MSQQLAPIIVLKFGGTSVSTRERWETLGAIARAVIAQGQRPIVVCSALSGISNMLEALLPRALSGHHEHDLRLIRERHRALGEAMGIDADALLSEELRLLEQLALGASLIGEVTPRLTAMVMATGELMATRLGAAFLNQQGQPTRWLDARDMLRATRDAHENDARHYLASACDYAPEPEALATLAAIDTGEIVLTQGFIARDDQGATVLLGRGGSDTSAAYFAAKLGAQRLEIWTDVPGMFTADPRQVPGARLLRKLDYFEAQELATTGAKVLHPRCLEPARRYKIPLHIRCTQAPDMEGTVISEGGAGSVAQVKAISTKKQLPLVSMETVGMWQQVGFLADVFARFKRNGVSIDQVATSETNVTVSLDPVANALDGARLDALLRDLSDVCTARTMGPCAAISLVGRDIRTILHKLGPVFEVFEEQRVYMMSQASSDLNLTFVVDEAQVERLVRKLHGLLFGDLAPDEAVGPTWRELFHDEQAEATSAPDVGARWWAGRRDVLLGVMAEAEGPRYVYDRATLEQTAARLGALDAVDARYYAIKANSNLEVLRLLRAQGMRLECVSPGEIARALSVGAPPAEILFTPNFAPIREYASAFEQGVTVTLDSLHPLLHHPEVFRGRAFLVRVDPGEGRGHHKHVRTAGPQSKFGVEPGELEQLIELARRADARIIGLHAHVGSGIRAAETWAENAQFLATLARELPEARVLNLGGGLGVVEKPGQPSLDLSNVAESLRAFKQANPSLELWIEPGRYLVAQAGVLLARVTQLKRKGARAYVGIDAGMNSLIRPALYGAFHEIVNLTRYEQPGAITADIVGPICETGDVLGYGRRLPETVEGDVLLIATAGAYGYAMGSHYNLREPALELMLEG